MVNKDKKVIQERITFYIKEIFYDYHFDTPSNSDFVNYSLLDLGFESIMLFDLFTILEDELNVKLDNIQCIGMTVRALSEYVCNICDKEKEKTR